MTLVKLLYFLRPFDLGAFETLAAREVEVDAVLLAALVGLACLVYSKIRKLQGIGGSFKGN